MKKDVVSTKETECCWQNLDKARYISRATWVCATCGRDVSLAYVLFREAKDK